MNFEKYKNSLKQYLKIKGHNPSNNPMFCFSPSHSNNESPACMIYDDNFKCGSCGIHGDIYDACEIITGISEKAKQYQEVEKTLLGCNIEPEKKKERFKPDTDSFLKLINYLKNHNYRRKGTLAFLKERGYTDDISEKMSKYFCYWPGFDIAIKEVGKEILKKSGVPLIHPEKNYSSWSHSGVVLKLSKGLKLCYYENNICEKRGTRSCYTFPMPGKLPENEIIILVEAELTAIAMRAIGFSNVFSTGGTNGLTIKALKEYLLATKEIIFAFDGDDSGKKASGIIKQNKNDQNKKKCYPGILINNNFKGIIKIAHLPDEKDPDDLIRENKIDELKSIIDKATIYESIENTQTKKKNPPFFFLGFDNRAYYILPKNQNVPLRVPRGDTTIKNWMREIANGEWWFENFQKEDEEGHIIYDQQAAMKWFRDSSYQRGIFNDEKILGIGVHKDNNNIVFNLGDSLLVEEKKLNYEDYKGKNIYCRSKIILKMEGKPWTTDDGINFIKQLKTFSFEKPIQFFAVCGFVAISWIASILNIRPSIWITAQSRAGKSTILNKIIKPGVGKQALYTEGICSEAFIRQTCGKDCRIPILDEFEAHTKTEMAEQKKILTLLRSSYSGSVSGKGTPDHVPISFHIKQMFCLASVNIRFDNDGDRTRIVVCRMKPKDKNDKNFCKNIKNFTGLRLRIFQKIKLINSYIEIAKNIMMENGHDNRTADTYSPFLVGFWMIMSDNDFFDGDEKIQGYILKAIKNISEPDYKDDEDRILDRIFKEKIKTDPSTELTIAEMLIKEKIDITGEILTFDNEIRRYGIRRHNSKRIECLSIDTDHPALKNILRDTAFSEYKEVLQRHPAVIDKSRSVYMAGKNTRCVVFSWEKIYEMYFKEEKEDEIPF